MHKLEAALESKVEVRLAVMYTIEFCRHYEQWRQSAFRTRNSSIASFFFLAR
jgi:hypothetical protein